MSNAKEISIMLAERAEYVALELLPNGRKQGKEWVVGNTSGGKGNSLSLCISGEKKGIWSDFATGERGDLLDLWQSTKGISFVQALDEARAFLGVSTPEFVAPKKTFTRPQKPERTSLEGGLLDYLTKTRWITKETLDKYSIKANNKGEILFPIMRNGELLNVKYLTPRKTEGEKNKWRQEADAEPCLFGWQGITEYDRSVVITEGEIDALSLARLGVKALSIPAGANNTQWLEYDYPNLDQFEDIVLMFDMDEAGQKNVIEIAQRLGLERTRVAKLQLKDANEMLTSGLSQELLEAVTEAKYLDPAELKAARDYQDELIDYFEGNLQEEAGKSLPFSSTAEKVKFRTAELSIWTGINGHGKSLLLGYNAIGLIEQKEKVCIFSGEMKPRRTLERMIRQIIGAKAPTPKYIEKAFDFLDGHLWLFDVTGNAKGDRLLEVFTYARKRYGITHFVIDSLMKCGFAEDDYNAQKIFMDKLCDFKNKHNVHVHLVAHPRKGEDEKRASGKMDIRGSGSLTDLADNVFSVWRNKIKEEKLSDGEEVGDAPDALLSCVKQRNGEWEGKIALWFNPDNLRYSDNSSNKCREWLRD